MSDTGDEPDWIGETDRDILRVLATELVLTPSIIAENTGYSRVSISRHLDTLRAGGLVEKVDRGKYRITYDGFEIVSEPTETPDDISPDE